ncbi:hypothetical protein ACA910_015879 [Epithemia clementina (nom. ined.)]
MKRPATSAKDSEAGGPHLMEYTKPASPTPQHPLTGKWKRRKDQPSKVSDFMFQHRRELSLCLICFSMVCLIIGTLIRSSSASQSEKESSALRSSQISSVNKKTASSLLTSVQKKNENLSPVKNPDELHRLREMPKMSTNTNESKIKEEKKNSIANVGDETSDKLVSKRFVMELGGLVKGTELESTSYGRVIIETRPDWAPLGVAHFHELVKDGFYDQCRFFRVVPNFVVQFGIAADPAVQQKWRDKQRQVKLMDDPVERSNQRGTVTYATSGKNTRNTQLFINKGDNAYLDKEGFAPFAQVVEGMEYVDRINPKYREKPSQGKIQRRGNEYLNEEYPDLSFVVTLREEDYDLAPN